MKQLKKIFLLLSIAIVIVGCGTKEAKNKTDSIDEEEIEVVEEALDDDALDDEVEESKESTNTETSENEAKSEEKEIEISNKEIKSSELTSKSTVDGNKKSPSSNQSSSENSTKSANIQTEQKSTSSKQSTSSASKASNSSSSKQSTTNTKQNSASKSVNEPKKEKQTVTVSVTIPSGVNGTGLSPTTVTIEEGDTILDASRKSGLNIKTRGAGATAYIYEINGLREFDEGPLSGWLVKVDGVEINKSAGAYLAKANQKIEWVYTTDFTK